MIDRIQWVINAVFFGKSKEGFTVYKLDIEIFEQNELREKLGKFFASQVLRTNTLHVNVSEYILEFKKKSTIIITVLYEYTSIYIRLC